MLTWKNICFKVLLSILIGQLAFLSAVFSVFKAPLALAASNSDSFAAIAGKDTTTSGAYTLSPSDVSLLATRDDNRYTTQGYWPDNTSAFDPTEYLAFSFSGSTIPAEAHLENVTFAHEYQVGTTGNFTATQYRIYTDSTLLGSINGSLPAQINSDWQETINLSSVVTDLQTLNNLSIRFLAYTQENKNLRSSHDFAQLSVTYHIPTAPNAPVLISPVDKSFVNSSQPTLTWQAANDVDGTIDYYEIYLDTQSDFSSPNVIHEKVTGLAFSPPSALTDGLHYWKVKAVDNDSLSSPDSSTWQFTVDTIAPNSPTNVKAIDHPSDNGKQIDVSWIAPDPLGDVAGYKVGVSESNNETLAVYQDAGNVLAATIAVTKNKFDYYFFVRAYDQAQNQSLPTAVVSAKAIDNLPPGVPTVEKIILTCSSCQARLIYKYSADTTRIITQVSTNEVFTEIVQVVSQEPPLGELTITGLSPNKTYYFRLVAYDESGNLAISNFLKGTPKANQVITIIPGVGGAVESVEYLVATKVVKKAAKKPTEGIIESHVAEALAAPAEEVTPTISPKATPTPTGAIKGGTKEEEQAESSRSRTILLIILLIAAVLAAYFGYRSVSQAGEPPKSKK